MHLPLRRFVSSCVSRPTPHSSYFNYSSRVYPTLVPHILLRQLLENRHHVQMRHQSLSHKKREKRIPKGGYWTRVLVCTSSIAAIAYFVDEYYYASVAQRSIRAVYVLSLVAYKYVNGHKHASADDLHEDCAELVFAMIRKNKGLYVKLGQAIANQGALFPIAYQKRFTRLYDDAPNDPWHEIDKTLRKCLGPEYETALFENIDHVPIASALIAQVHKATLKSTHTHVAVKVQHLYIARQIHADLAVYRLMSLVYSKVFDLPLDFSTAYISEQLLKEADFTQECANSEKLAALIDADTFARTLDVYVPNSYPELAASQVLITEWIDGILLTDRQLLINRKVSLRRLMTQYISIFAKQIFDYGFVHSDAHPGNILVRLHNGCQQMVILDHGLYIELPSKFKHEYCLLWRNLLGFGLQIIVDLADEWGIGSPDLLQLIVQLKPPAKVKAENAPLSTELLRMLLADEKKFPPDLLFLLRTMRMMQNLNQSMGSPINRINLLTEISLISRNKRDISWTEVVLFVTVRATLFCSNVVFWLFRTRQILLGDRYGDKGEGIEDYIDKYMRENARALGINLVV